MKKKIISVVGARPNFMKVAPIDKALKKYSGEIEHIIVHTGQHYDENMSDVFFKDLEMPNPNYYLGVGSGTHAEQTGKIMIEFEKICIKTQPDLVIVVGDVNSTIACSLTAVKLGIKVAHIESGLRSFDRTMPEEFNRIATDSICDYYFITEQSGIDNLKREGVAGDKIFFVGNTMIDSQKYAISKLNLSGILDSLSLLPKEYVLITLHRPSNVDEPNQLKEILDMLVYLSNYRKIVFPIHPRTRKNLKFFGFDELTKSINNLMLIESLGLIDFLKLMINSDFVVTDSGGIQEETTALGIPCITLRKSTERPITCEIGTNVLVKPGIDNINEKINDFLLGKRKKGSVPPLWDGKASERIAKILVNEILNVEF